MRISKRERRENGEDEIFEIIFAENLTTRQQKQTKTNKQKEI